MIEYLSDIEYFELAKKLATTFDDYHEIDDIGISIPKKYLDGISLNIKYHREKDLPNYRIVRKLYITDNDCMYIDTYGIINRSMHNDKMSKIVRRYLNSIKSQELAVR